MNPLPFDAGARPPQPLPTLSLEARECVAAARRMSWIDPDGLEQLAQSLRRLAQDTGSDYLLAWARGVQARICILRGRPRDALELADQIAQTAAAYPADTDLIRLELRSRSHALHRLDRWAELMMVQLQLLSLAYRTQTRLMAMKQDLMSQYAQQRHVLVQRQLAGERDDAMRFLGHDLRSPLSSILSGIDLLPEPQDPALHQTLQQVRHCADRALRISAGVLGHLQSAQLDERSFAPVNLPALVDDVCAEVEPAARSRQIRIALRIDPLADRCNAHTAGSHEFLHRALINVMDNALRHAPPGSEVSVALRPGGRYWRIAVADSGPGFNGAAGMSSVAPGLGVVLDARAQAGSSVHGLGLRLVHEVMERHHGIVRIGRNEPHGALVELLLPVVVGSGGQGVAVSI